MPFETIQWKNNQVVMINQLVLPHRVEYVSCQNAEQVAQSIQNMVIRGAPAIGIAAAYGIALEMRLVSSYQPSEWKSIFAKTSERLSQTRPTAVNLFWAIQRMTTLFEHLCLENPNRDVMQERLLQEAHTLLREDIETNRKIGEYGAQFVKDGDTLLTHCNAGALATGGYGTATAVMRIAHQQGKRIHVLADETRPYLQGARLTTWELEQDGISVELITDNMAGHFLKKGEVDLCIVGTDRTAMNGDVANKIGTYMVAVCARENEVPFYVAAPTSSIDPHTLSGEAIPIEERSPEEVLQIQGKRIASPTTKARHVAFDVTPAKYITAIITEKGMAYAPYTFSLRKILSS